MQPCNWYYFDDDLYAFGLFGHNIHLFATANEKNNNNKPISSARVDLT